MPIRIVLFLVLLWSWAATAQETELALERGRVALALERTLDARQIAMEAALADPSAWRVLQLYLEASAAAGMDDVAFAAFHTLEREYPVAALVGAWELGYRDPEMVLHLVTDEPGNDGLNMLLWAWAMGERGDPMGAERYLANADFPEAVEYRLQLLCEMEQYEAAADVAMCQIKKNPNRPDVLLPIWQSEHPALVRVKEVAVRSVKFHLAPRRDLLWLYRARRMLIAAHEWELSREACELIEAGGDERPHYRTPLSRRSRLVSANVLSHRGKTKVPNSTPTEMTEFARDLSKMLLEGGYVEEGIRVWQRLREEADSTEAALEHGHLLLAHNKNEDAHEVAIQALVLAISPRADDTARLNRAQLAVELADAWGLFGETSRRTGQDDLAKMGFFLAHALHPLPERERLVAEVGHPEIALADVLMEIEQRLNGGDDDPFAWAVLESGCLVEPTPKRLHLRGKIHERKGHKDIAFVSYVIGEGSFADVSRTWSGLGSVEAAAQSVKDHHQRSMAEYEERMTREGFVSSVFEVPGAAHDLPRVGRPMPDWEIEGTRGPLSGESLKGQVVLLAFWATWCGPCQKELPELEVLSQRLQAENLPVRLVAISLDEQEPPYKRWISRSSYEHLDVGRTPGLKDRFQIGTLPQSWLVDQTGMVVSHHRGYFEGDASTLEREIQDLLQR
ncbi:MAG: TlpA family protein disulfide reductase [Proteobacteria bacterium]|nr:TlpA family protein disulfide reductase [Pseudomonadota bacterium]